ncbi:MAG: hypothetical protein HBSAPP03_18630 [Phycisphaerae bacterium]|nr:MAG: hypothetical protein HBSAPP03_18630 [Phycisphaerae bacterium]
MLISHAFVSVVAALNLGQPPAAAPGTPAEPLDWKRLEAPYLTGHVQLTFPEQFVRAGEAYFSPDGEWIVFQAVPRPAAGEEPDPFYAMYVARLVRAHGRVTGLDSVTRISPKDSANTCGWFHPSDPNTVLMGSTVVRPSDDQKSGFQVGERKYRWMFPAEMEVVEVHPFFMGGGIASPDGRTPGRSFRGGAREQIGKPTPVFSRPNYDAECSYDSTGRFVLYSHVEDALAMGRADANIYVYDTVKKTHTPLVAAGGYDGGPFFGPGDGWITYRSDRKGDDLLQLFVADIRHEKDEHGVNVPVGIEKEYQLTNNEHVNWCPFWHPSGEFLVYATSEVGHHNYEVFAIETPVWKLKNGSVKPEALRRVRITHADGADVLPAFSADGRWMMWTSSRGAKMDGETRPSSQLWIAEWAGGQGANPFAGGAER